MVNLCTLGISVLCIGLLTGARELLHRQSADHGSRHGVQLFGYKLWYSALYRVSEKTNHWRADDGVFSVIAQKKCSAIHNVLPVLFKQSAGKSVRPAFTRLVHRYDRVPSFMKGMRKRERRELMKWPGKPLKTLCPIPISRRRGVDGRRDRLYRCKWKKTPPGQLHLR
jgi:hypothetical protein